MMVFTVEDQGVGIPKDQQWRVFERFESRSHGSSHRGAGLGLSIVKSLVELHGGTVSLESEPGEGTRVTVRLPEHGRSRMTAPRARPNMVPQGRYRPAAPPRRVPCMPACLPPSHHPRRQRAPSLSAWARISRLRRGAAIVIALSGRARRRQDDARPRHHPCACRQQERGDPEPDLHAGADLRDTAHAGGASRSLSSSTRPPSSTSWGSTSRCSRASPSSNGPSGRATALPASRLEVLLER